MMVTAETVCNHKRSGDPGVVQIPVQFIDFDPRQWLVQDCISQLWFELAFICFSFVNIMKALCAKDYHSFCSEWWSFLCDWETLVGNLNSRTGVSVLNWNKRHVGLVSHLLFDKAVLDMPLGIEEPARAWQLTVLVAVTHLLSFTVGTKDSEYKKWTICTRICLLLDSVCFVDNSFVV